MALLVGQAGLQVEARLRSPDKPPPFTVIEPGDDPIGIAVGGGAVWTANFRDDTVTKIQP